MNVYAYPQPGKAKSEQILVAFCEGAGGYVERRGRLHAGMPAAFYGTVGIEALFRQAQAAGEWFYLDNAYFDCARGRYFRASRNALQHAAPLLERRDLDRLAELGIRAAPWRSSGKHVLVVEQSDYFMREVACWLGGLQAWRDFVVAELGRHTDRPLVVRRWLRDKAKASSTLAEDLAGAWAVVTHSSAAANEALMAGIPVFTTGQCVAAELGNDDLSQIEAPVMPDDCRDEWAARLAASQWRLDEMRSGLAWRMLQRELVHV